MCGNRAVELTAHLRELIKQHTVGSVAERWPPVVHEAYGELVGALVDDEDVEQRDAEYAATQAMIELSKTLAQCVAEQQTDEARAMRKPLANSLTRDDKEFT